MTGILGQPLDRIKAFANWLWRGDGERTPWLRRTLAILFAFLVPIPILLILLFRFVPLPGTPQMLTWLIVGDPVHYQWVAYENIAPALGRAVIGSEDQNFCSHNGFDWKSIDKALKANKRGRPLRGASTISQQVARTMFLLPTRSWVRKGVEAYLTVLIEALWPKKRILTAYLNLVDWGRGNFGAEAASQAYFHKPAARLTAADAARLATILPDPEKWRADNPGPYVAERTETILSRMAEVTRDNLDACVRR